MHEMWLLCDVGMRGRAVMAIEDHSWHTKVPWGCMTLKQHQTRREIICPISMMTIPILTNFATIFWPGSSQVRNTEMVEDLTKHRCIKELPILTLILVRSVGNGFQRPIQASSSDQARDENYFGLAVCKDRVGFVGDADSKRRLWCISFKLSGGCASELVSLVYV